VTRADAPKLLEYNDTRWELEAFGGGTRLTLWHNIDRRFISMGAAGWHICFDVLDHLLSGTPIGRIVGGEAMKFGGWQRLNAEYAMQFGIETPNWPSQAAQESWIEVDEARMSSPFGNMEVRGARENNLMSYTWAPYGLESVVTWTLTPSSTGTHLRMEQSGFRPDQQQAHQGAN
jgi:hypothetical protein